MYMCIYYIVEPHRALPAAWRQVGRWWWGAGGGPALVAAAAAAAAAASKCLETWRQGHTLPRKARGKGRRRQREKEKTRKEASLAAKAKVLEERPKARVRSDSAILSLNTGLLDRGLCMASGIQPAQASRLRISPRDPRMHSW